jgi:hypothetical protein
MQLSLTAESQCKVNVLNKLQCPPKRLKVIFSFLLPPYSLLCNQKQYDTFTTNEANKLVIERIKYLPLDRAMPFLTQRRANLSTS